MPTIRTYEGDPKDSPTALHNLVPYNDSIYGGEWPETEQRHEGGGYPEWDHLIVMRAAVRALEIIGQLEQGENHEAIGAAAVSTEVQLVAA